MRATDVLRFAFTGVVLTCGSFAAAHTPPSDFNDDGFDDLAIGVPFEDIGSFGNCGAVNVLYGSVGGLDTFNDQFWHQDVADIVDIAETGDQFGSALAWGDFNHDGFSDLAIGIPLEDIGNIFNCGAVAVLYGSHEGLTGEDSQFWHQDVMGILNECESGDNFGSSLTVGDFDGDGFDDLAIGIPGEDIGAVPNAGAVSVLYGDDNGLRSFADDFWSQNSGTIDETADINDQFGWALAAGDFDDDGRDDLAIGVRNESIGIIGGAGAVCVIYGSGFGLNSSGDDFWSQNSFGIGDSPEHGDGFGFALATGDFDGDGYEDLMIGVPFENSGSRVDVGAAQVIYGAGTGLRAARSRMFAQGMDDTSGLLGSFDTFGFALAAADFDGDGIDDCAIGVPGEDVFNFGGVGAIHVLYGTLDGLGFDIADDYFHQDSPGVNEFIEAGDAFGASLAVGDYNQDGFFDVAVGVPFEDLGFIDDAGAVNLLFGSSNGIDASDDQFWTQNTAGVNERADEDDGFGFVSVRR